VTTERFAWGNAVALETIKRGTIRIVPLDDQGTRVMALWSQETVINYNWTYQLRGMVLSAGDPATGGPIFDIGAPTSDAQGIDAVLVGEDRVLLSLALFVSSPRTLRLRTMLLDTSTNEPTALITNDFITSSFREEITELTPIPGTDRVLQTYHDGYDQMLRVVKVTGDSLSFGTPAYMNVAWTQGRTFQHSPIYVDSTGAGFATVRAPNSGQMPVDNRHFTVADMTITTGGTFKGVTWPDGYDANWHTVFASTTPAGTILGFAWKNVYQQPDLGRLFEGTYSADTGIVATAVLDVTDDLLDPEGKHDEWGHSSLTPYAIYYAATQGVPVALLHLNKQDPPTYYQLFPHLIFDPFGTAPAISTLADVEELYPGLEEDPVYYRGVINGDGVWTPSGLWTIHAGDGDMSYVTLVPLDPPPPRLEGGQVRGGRRFFG
jgi:hypothetical protein